MQTLRICQFENVASIMKYDILQHEELEEQKTERHNTRGVPVSQDPNEPCSHQVYQAMEFWERD